MLLPHDKSIILRDINRMEKEIKTYLMSIKVTEEELFKLKQAAWLEEYTSNSKFVRRTALLKITIIIVNKEKEDG